MAVTYLRVKNWERFQHADATKRGRDPIWIKNYTRLLHDQDYLDLTASQRGLLHGIWLLYASTGRSVNETTARRLLSTNKADSRHFRSNLDALEQAGFIEFCPDSVQTVSSLDKRREEEKDLKLLDETPVENLETRLGRLMADQVFMRWVANIGRHHSRSVFRVEANKCFGVSGETADAFYDKTEVAA